MKMSWMSDSSRPPSDESPPEHVIDQWMVAIYKRLDEREQLCRTIALYANLQGLDCDWQLVNRHMKWFIRWYNGGLATGYLMGRTGVKRKIPDIRHWSE